MFETLTERLERAIKTLKGQGRITEVNVASTVKEIRRALIEADVNYKIAKEFTDRVKEKAIGQKVLTAVSPGQLMVKIVYDELVQLMGSEKADLNLKGNPAVILLAGLQGSGKTTLAAKLAYFLKNKKNRTPLLVACDVYRPAAIEQLKILGEQISVPVYSDPSQSDVLRIARDALRHASLQQFDTVVVDTAGRLAIDQNMMEEIKALKETLHPSETLFVVDAMTGQDAVHTAKVFQEMLDYDGVVLTKLDGDARGGAALSIKYETNKPIKLVSIGEKPEQLDIFYPDRLAQRILGMGDIVTLVEKAQEQFDQQEARRLQEKLRKNKFDFNDFLSQLRQVRKMGNMKDLLSMIPGVGRAVKNLDVDEKHLKRIEAIILSMTPEERANPELLNGSRRKRIAAGSGTSLQEVNQFIRQFEEMRKLMKKFSGQGGVRPPLPFRR
ncbi:MAG: signal recognition particle protein [Chitinophagales bacterium]|nr:signal recognition particle protein [Chitinophagales bacterium]MDW8427622.1 signal recognition particle protein [Chitinophagales bacterium]